MDIKTAAYKGAAKLIPVNQRLQIINDYIDDAIEIANKEIDIKKIQEKLAYNEDRSVLLKIMGFAEQGIMIKFSNGKLIKVFSDEKPTVTITLGYNDFIQVSRGKITIDYIAFFSRESDIDGEHWFRDLPILRELFGAFSYVRSKMNLDL